MVDETDRLLREAYQSWLPTVLELIQSNDDGFSQPSASFFPCSASALRTRRRWWVQTLFTCLMKHSFHDWLIEANATEFWSCWKTNTKLFSSAWSSYTPLVAYPWCISCWLFFQMMWFNMSPLCSTPRIFSIMVKLLYCIYSQF